MDSIQNLKELDEDAFYQFLIDRDIDESHLSAIKDERIDANTVLLMNDTQLAAYVPKHGDRVALVEFCKKITKPNNVKSPGEKRKNKLLEKLRKKFKRCEDGNDEPPSSLAPQLVRGKTTRVINIGWLDFDRGTGIYKQVRQKKGGGTRHVTVDKSAKKADILQLGRDLFFPGGASKKGTVAEFSFDLKDFQETDFDGELTLKDMYAQTSLHTLNFYVATRRKEDLIGNDSGDDDIMKATISRPPVSPVCPEERTSESSTAMIILNPSNGLSEILGPAAISTPINELFLQEQSADIEINFGPVNDLFGFSLEDTLPIQPQLEMPFSDIVIKRHFCLNDMIKAFSEENILEKRLQVRWQLDNGELEDGVGDGVYRDCLSQFWEEFYSECTVGAEYKVPFLRHDFGAEKWRSVARIYVAGWREFKYIPISIAPAFMEEAIYGRVCSNLTDVFLKFLDFIERDVLTKAMEDTNSVDGDELLDVLDQYKCRKRVTNENIKIVVEELAHKEIIQTPMYVIDCWRPILAPMAFQKQEELHSYYQRLIPDTKKVLKALVFPEILHDEEKNVTDYLKRYVKGLDETHIKRFLRFCTGSDLMMTEHISVAFTDLTGLKRRPIAHTCSCLLEIPKDFDNFPQFRTEFNTVLDSNVWVMDMP